MTKVEISNAVIVNVNEHDYARGSRAAKIMQWILESAIRLLLKMSPRTAVIANVSLKGRRHSIAMYVEDMSLIARGARVVRLPDEGGLGSKTVSEMLAHLSQANTEEGRG